MIEKIKKELEKIEELKDKLIYLVEQLEKAKDEGLREEIKKLIKELEESLEAKVEAEIEEIPVRRELVSETLEEPVETEVVTLRREPLEVGVAEEPITESGQYSSSYGLSTASYSLGFDPQEVASGTYDDIFRDRVINELREEGALPHDAPLTPEVAKGRIEEKVRGIFPGKSQEEIERMTNRIVYGGRKKEKRPGDYLTNKEAT